MLHSKLVELYFAKLDFLYYKGLSEGKIVPFDDEFYSKLNNTYVSGLPVSIHIKHLRPSSPPGKCYERSLYLFFCFKDALLVRGHHKNLRVKYGKGHEGHGWIEIGDYVYDPTYLMRFDRNLYYQMFGCKKVKKYTHEEYCRDNPNYYDDVLNTSLDDFKLGGRKRMDLIAIIPIVEATANLPGHEELLKDLKEFMQLIEYDEKQIYDEMVKSVKEVMFNKRLVNN